MYLISKNKQNYDFESQFVTSKSWLEDTIFLIFGEYIWYVYIKGCTKHSPIPTNIIKIIFLFLMLVFVKVRNNIRKKKVGVFWRFAPKVKFTLAQQFWIPFWRSIQIGGTKYSGCMHLSGVTVWYLYIIININNSINK